MIPTPPAPQLPSVQSLDETLPSYSETQDGPLVIHWPVLDGLVSNSPNDTVSNVVTPNSYSITEGGAYGYTKGTARSGSSSTSEDLSHPRHSIDRVSRRRLWSVQSNRKDVFWRGLA